MEAGSEMAPLYLEAALFYAAKQSPSRETSATVQGDAPL